jgi:hypothetical protein
VEIITWTNFYVESINGLLKMRKGTFLTILFCFLGVLAFGQVDPTNKNAVSLTKKNLAYYWTGVAYPPSNSEYLYGFKIISTGCIVTRSIERNNRRVVKAVNKVYGKNWFEENVR